MSKAAIDPFCSAPQTGWFGLRIDYAGARTGASLDDAETTARWMNGIVEKCIMLAPEQYMWLHRRFKTRPEGTPSRY